MDIIGSHYFLRPIGIKRHWQTFFYIYMKYMNMQNRFLLFALGLFFFSASARAQIDSFIVDGVYRNYIIHLPAGYNGSTAYPLVFNLHGYTSNASEEELYTNMDATSDANHFILVYPNGIANYWNAFGTGADDVKFIRELIDTISSHYHVNSRRVYSCGISNGGYMSYTLACSLSDKIAAIASVSGTMSLNTYTTCSPARKVPVMHVHGTADLTVPYATGAANSIGVEQTLAFWRDTNDCRHITDTIDLPNTSTGDSCTVQRIDYAHCDNSEVLFYKITNGGHTWPNGTIGIPAYGYTDRDISANDEIWKFFNRYTLDGPTAIEETTIDPTLNIHPNPSTGILRIKTDSKINGTDIYDLTGRKVMSFTGEKELNISTLTPGMYIVHIVQNSNRQTLIKVVKE